METKKDMIPDTAQVIDDLYQDQRSPSKTPDGKDPGENGAQRPLNIVTPNSEQNPVANTATETTDKGKHS